MTRDDASGEEHIRALFEAKARAELAHADTLAPGSDLIAWSGALLASVALVKGMPGPAEASGGAALSGPDGAAVAKALVALGWPAGSWFATVSRPEPTIASEKRVARLRLQIEAVDALVVIALDGVAAQDVAAAFDLTGELAPGQPVVAFGRRLVAVDGFEESLGHEVRKRRVWRQMQAAAPPGPVL